MILDFAPHYLILGLALVCAVSLALTPNRWIRRRLLSALILALFALALEVGQIFNPGGYASQLRTASIVVGVWSFTLALVTLALNPLRGRGVSEKWPAIVQDALVLGALLLLGLFYAKDEFLALGVASSLVLGFALRDTLGNLFAGLALQSEKPFHVGDWVSVGRREGKVLEATWRATKIRTKSGNFIVIPNSVISQDAIINFSSPSPIQRLERVIPMPHEVPPNNFKQVVVEAMGDVTSILRDPKPDVLTDQFDNVGIHYRCRFWINDYARSEPITDQFMTKLHYRLGRAGLPLPLPVRDVRVTQAPQEERRWEAPLLSPSDFLERVDLFSGLDEDVKRRIADCMKPVRFGTAETIIRQDDAGDSMCFVRTGAVRVVLEKNGITETLAELGPGQFFGEMALLTGEPRSASVVALDDVDSFLLERESFRQVLVEFPKLAEQLSEVMARRRGQLDASSAELAAKASTPALPQKTLLGRIQKFFSLE